MKKDYSNTPIDNLIGEIISQTILREKAHGLHYVNNMISADELNATEKTAAETIGEIIAEIKRRTGDDQINVLDGILD